MAWAHGRATLFVRRPYYSFYLPVVWKRGETFTHYSAYERSSLTAGWAGMISISALAGMEGGVAVAVRRWGRAVQNNSMYDSYDMYDLICAASMYIANDDACTLRAQRAKKGHGRCDDGAGKDLGEMGR
ncbi:hypothetical protein V490_06093 [Pseudogymnoascus sp. VKM F-3557]|nr:hypothetical protein V490_06093 [Pseudogymnoascus sp. VKM F-3557]